MSTIIKFELKELRKLANDKDSCVLEKTVTQNLALQPWCLGNLKDSIKSLLDYKIGKFDKEFNGILLSYKNLHILQNVGTIRNDNAEVHFQVQADYFIFRPRVGATLRGIVNKKSVTHLGVLIHRVFNVVIPRPTEEPGNKWLGSTIVEGQEVVFRIVVLDMVGALPYIRGELDEKFLQYAGDMEDDVVKHRYIDPLNVSYVNFDKTKPNLQKYTIGDSQHQGPPRNSTQNPTKSTVQYVQKNHQKNKIETNKQTNKKTKNNSLQASTSKVDACAEINMTEKPVKIKRQSTSKVDACAENNNLAVKIKKHSMLNACAENNITEKPVKIKKQSKAIDETMTPKNTKKNRQDAL